MHSNNDNRQKEERNLKMTHIHVLQFANFFSKGYPKRAISKGVRNQMIYFGIMNVESLMTFVIFRLDFNVEKSMANCFFEKILL